MGKKFDPMIFISIICVTKIKNWKQFGSINGKVVCDRGCAVGNRGGSPGGFAGMVWRPLVEHACRRPPLHNRFCHASASLVSSCRYEVFAIIISFCRLTG